MTADEYWRFSWRKFEQLNIVSWEGRATYRQDFIVSTRISFALNGSVPRMGFTSSGPDENADDDTTFTDDDDDDIAGEYEYYYTGGADV